MFVPIVQRIAVGRQFGETVASLIQLENKGSSLARTLILKAVPQGRYRATRISGGSLDQLRYRIVPSAVEVACVNS